MSKKILKHMNFLSRFIVVPLLGLFIILLNGCYSDHGLATDEYDVVATYYKENLDYTSFKTYTMPDTIVHIVDEGEEDELGRANDQLILSLVAENMQALGYRRITNPQVEKPDLGIVIAATSATNLQVYYNYSWGGYWGYPGYGYYYPPYWWGPTVEEYRTGTVFINMADPDEFDQDQKLLATVWLGVINGLLEDTKSNIRDRLTRDINQAYTQSPYLGTSN
jgi:hypothetical protein